MLTVLVQHDVQGEFVSIEFMFISYILFLTRQVDSELNVPVRVLIFLGPCKYLQVVQNGTIVPTVLVGKLDGRGGSEVLATIHMLKLNHFVSHPMLGITDNSPIVTIIALHITRSKARNFLLSRQWALDIVRVQVLH